MDDKLIEKNDEQPVKPKREYAPPALTRYGKLQDLTAAGTGSKTEPNPGNPDQPLDRMT